MSRRALLPEAVLANLARLTDAVREAEAADLPWQAKVRMHFLRNYTTESLDPFLKFHAMRDGIATDISHGGYGTMVQELLDEDSPVLASPPDMIVVALLAELVDPAILDAGWTRELAGRQIEDLLDLLLARTGALVVAHTLVPPIDRIGSASTGLRRELEALNRGILDRAKRHPGRLQVVDLASLLEGIGAGAAIDLRFWKSAQAPFRRPLLDLYARRIVGWARALSGRSRKCLVLDCDNTLWGGVVGEDGIDGIVLDDRSEHGRGFLAFQEQLLRLHDRGIMLALNSKNNEADVLEVIDRHPHCLLERSHLVAWRINWLDKASNLESLATELNIGLDSMVFVDDSPQERGLVQELLPDVAVLAVPDDIRTYASLLDRDGYFEALAATAEDLARTRMYREQATRQATRNNHTTLDEYLESLQTVLTIGEMRNSDVERVGQLTRKTNQFNLTTRRYSDDDIRRFLTDPRSLVFVMSVADRFGDLGLTGVLIATRSGDVADIDTLLMSCRVLGRRIEFAFVAHCLRAIDRKWGPSSVRAAYVPTRKNLQVRDFWLDAGFTMTSESEDGSLEFERLAGDSVEIPAGLSITSTE